MYCEGGSEEVCVSNYGHTLCAQPFSIDVRKVKPFENAFLQLCTAVVEFECVSDGEMTIALKSDTFNG